MRRFIALAAVIGALVATAAAQAQWVKVYHAGAGAAVAAPHVPGPNYQPTPGPTSY